MKTYSTQPEHISKWDFADFVEVLIVPGIPIKPFLDFDVPFRVHCAHAGFGVNFSDPSKWDHNIDCLRQALEAADSLGSPTVVLHPSGDAREGSKEYALDALSRISDAHILLENLPELNMRGEQRICYKPSEMAEFLSLGFGLCFDFGHAIASAAALNVDYKKFCDRFIGLGANYFHVSNGLVRSEQDLHLPLLEGEFDLDYIKDRVIRTKSAEIVLETPFNPEQNIWEYEFFKR